MNRRDLLKSILVAPLAMSSALRSAQATAGDRVLVVVFMRGGWDGLNVVVPYAEDTYYSLRPSLAIRPPSGGDPLSALDLDGFFGFHPSMSALYAMYQAGQVAVMPAVHYDNASRSHFLGQDIIEAASLTSADSGWLARYLGQAGGDPLAKAISLSDQVPLSLTGLKTPVSAFPDLASLSLAASAADRTVVADVIARSYAWGLPAVNPNANAMQGIGTRLLDELNSLRAAVQMSPENGATYPENAFGRQMKQTAALIKARVGLEIVTISLPGWDTHSNQGSGDPTARMPTLLSIFSKAVSAFFTDLGASASRALVVTASEFGRTAAENGSAGTDHGNATTWMAIGPSVNGGIHTGSGWPGLSSLAMVDGRALAHSVDFRSVYAHVLTRHLGATNVSTVLPGFTGSEIGILV